MSARENLQAMVRTDQGSVTAWSPGEVRNALDAFRAEVLREAADTVAELRDTTDVNVAEYDRYDFRQKVALRDAEDRIRRMASKAEAGTPTP